IFIQNGEAKVKEKEERRKELKEGQKQGKMPVLQLLGNRMIIGIYLSQYCSTAITYFFLTWFPIYLVTEKQMTVLEVGFISMFPALGAFIGQLAGGAFSDSLIKKGLSLSRARKIPIIVGMVCSMTIIGANYTESIVIVILIMSFAFFGRGFGGLGWAIITETSPKKVAGINGAMFNTFGNVAGITTPIIIGYILEVTGSFHMALLFIGGNALVAIFSYTFIVGEIKEVEIY
ncbi:MAG TPA: MFS transporter, partial [Chondromyces sp.]|nr:MFS transporter [Chondromyces sp.]